MREPSRIDTILNKLSEFWKEHPDLRFAQMIMAIAMTGEHNPKLFNLEDEQFLNLLDERRKQLQK